MVAVGAVGPTSVRLWVRVLAPGPLRVRCWSARGVALDGTVELPPGGAERDGTGSFLVPDEVRPARPLAPSERYRFLVEGAGGRLVGAGAFVTAPGEDEAPRRLAMGLMSCSQPFTARGRVSRRAAAMLTAAYRCLERHDVRLVLMVGDQMYADRPQRLSLFDPAHFAAVAPPGRRSLRECTAEEVRALYQERYRRFWGVPGWQALLARFPCCPIWDDHELIDNWGTDPAHLEPDWQRVFAGARAAYFDYQGSRVHPLGAPRADFGYGLELGPAAVFVLDLRSERCAGPEACLLRPAQLAALERFLARNAARPAALVVASVPVVHLPQWAARALRPFARAGEDFADRWAAGPQVRDRDRLLRLLHEHQRRHPEQLVALLSGDIHIGCAHELRWGERGPRAFQLVSSALTNLQGLPERVGAQLSIAFTRRVATEDDALAARVRFLHGEPGATQNPYSGLNVGVVELDLPPGEPARLRFLLYGHRGREPLCVYRSPWQAALPRHASAGALDRGSWAPRTPTDRSVHREPSAAARRTGTS